MPVIKSEENIERLILKFGAQGGVIYSVWDSGYLTALAKHYGRKIKCEKVFAMDNRRPTPNVEVITKIELLNAPQK